MSGTLEKPKPKPKKRMVRIYSDFEKTSGKPFRFRSGGVYRSDKAGTIRRLDKPDGTKKERRRRRRESQSA